MHAALMPAAVGRPGVLDDRQCIHVGPYPQLARAAAVAQDADYAGLADTCVNLVAPLFERPGDQRRGATFLETEFRMGVDILSGGMQVAGDVVEPGKDVLMSGHVECPRAGCIPVLFVRCDCATYQRQVAFATR
ncbi:hypothetical protein D3C76_931890 [compost metagenome]